MANVGGEGEGDDASGSAAAAARTPSPLNGSGRSTSNTMSLSISTTVANEESSRLLSPAEKSDDDDDDDDDDTLVVHPSPAPSAGSLRRAGSPRTPRSSNRVRFDLRPSVVNTPRDGDTFDIDEEDYAAGGGGGDQAHRRPLLEDIEAPSVALANGPWGSGDVHEWAEEERRRPKSGLRSAFMNMANSIIGAGIIGQPYVFKQAGLLSGIALLVGLTIIVDWTIRLIVINSKLSGSNSFQGTVHHCFGKGGLIAISIAQWVFAFGGMVAFGVIVGDSIPHVLLAVWPGLRDVPVVGLLADRRAVIVVFTLGISFPLTLYRDIAKVRGPEPGFLLLLR